ncbi:MAG: pirin family protein [Rectinemataceae bacterium]
MRKVRTTYRAIPTEEGAGVRLKRVFGYRERGAFDPFLMLDHFGSDNPSDYIAGFPWHPHRGIETVTYLLSGKVGHGDSMGNKGVIGPGDAQWMTAGSGIIHQEMPEPGADGKTMEGFQLWVNLPAALKMTSPRYRAVEAGEIPRVETEGAKIAVLAGKFGAVRGATPELFVPVRYVIVEIEAGKTLKMTVPSGHNAAVYVYRGKVSVAGTKIASGEAANLPAEAGETGETGETDKADETGDDMIPLSADAETGASLLFISGKPLREPIAWGGPIVMNTRSELELAFEEYEKGRFIKTKAAGSP